MIIEVVYTRTNLAMAGGVPSVNFRKSHGAPLHRDVNQGPAKITHNSYYWLVDGKIKKSKDNASYNFFKILKDCRDDIRNKL